MSYRLPDVMSSSQTTARPDANTAMLRGGHLAVLRPLTPADRNLYLAAFEHLAPESRRMRFLSPKPSLSEAEIRYFTEVDHHDHEAITAIVRDEGVGVARFVRDAREPRVADVAVAVVDEWQRRGVGSALLRRVADRARQEGVDRLRATVASSNGPMLATIRRLGASWRTTSSSRGVLEIEITLGAPVA
jgi:GNAT superfamily N-acetyltransferase